MKWHSDPRQLVLGDWPNEYMENEDGPIGMTPIFIDTRPWVIADLEEIAEKMKE